ncbi:Do family serine endopeptidase [Neoehrlichia mikurensis]|uniref:Do family serine endopeptidase n=1 Tax=Neoehrlichia mikurensis TaxID=89586 RepID=A0A9Q9BZC9_9RICK|nr:Do family serine endopeptidase [Neoehrlichia mikurensis]QXK91644.1 Do family serine endopeptidase [Neoehrlichia mikurensis]QXK92855.1 Do family serine endopeptidase [Neoehrlichia mikurensis]QXK93335.1 Do family serine endopeptidase [Neoehrlichia mikurensis]UTO55723.1 Do family serine endopeptidase [Neoehrlichia mikurensis]UTO56640.1 Do family serine endopeptidase [Neoehrlichia mikurensis]
MKKRFLLLILLTLISTTSSFADTSHLHNQGFSHLTKKLIPGVVNISTEQVISNGERYKGGKQFFRFPGIPRGMLEEFLENFEPFFNKMPSEPREATSLGSGFIIDESGIIVTNYHVIANATKITVTFSDNTQARASVLGTDPQTDIAVLKVKVNKKLAYVKLGNSDNALVGDWVLAIGNPFGLGVSVSTGIISARGRDIDMGTSNEFLQTDAAINRGHSGGPLFNTDGEVIGINTAIFSPQQGGGNVGIAFAIPSNSAAPIINILSQGKKVEHGWLGIVVQAITQDMLESLNMKNTNGVLIASVVKDSPADKAGLKPGDVILEFNGVKTEKAQQLTQLVRRAEANKKATMKIYRNGNTISINVNIGKLSSNDQVSDTTPQDAQIINNEALGLTVGNIPQDYKTNETNDVSGVIVLKIDRESDAFSKGIRKNDIITQVNQTIIKNTADFKNAIKKAKSKKSILLRIQRENNPQIFIAIKLK